ncbi:MAG: glycerate kinase, partial [bacterium]|nr:glycerate kinase [bacterium]
FGVGDMIAFALTRLQTTEAEILIGIGGSATNDGGIGMAQALGWQFLDKDGKDICFRKKEGYCAQSITGLHHILPPQSYASLSSSPSGLRAEGKILNSKFRIFILSDVNNPLLGPTGASYVYARQKGAKDTDLPELEKLLTHLRDIAKHDLNTDMNTIKGGGAAGGLGAGLVTFLGAEIKPGLTEVARLTGLEEKIQQADLVITGEGKIDAQTEFDKGPHLIAKLAKKHGKKVIALCGFKAASPGVFDAVFGTNELPDFNPKTIASSAATLLSKLAKETIITTRH